MRTAVRANANVTKGVKTMGSKTSIEWTKGQDGSDGATWTPIRARNIKTGKIGWHCEHATTGCEFCYAEGMNKRLGTGLPFKPGHRKDIEIFLDEKMLEAPLRWKRPRNIFVCSMTDLFAEFVQDEWIVRILDIIRRTSWDGGSNCGKISGSGQHIYQVLTKRADRMASFMPRLRFNQNSKLNEVGLYLADDDKHSIVMKNMWLGISAERQQEADERIPLLLQTPAAVRFISVEPLLAPIDLEAMPFPDGDARHRWSALTGQAIMYGEGVNGHPDMRIRIDKPLRNKLDWVIVGGESGTNARPMHPDWVRSLRDQCAAATPFFFKQWGMFAPATGENARMLARQFGRFDAATDTIRVGKNAAGRLLDGREHNDMPVQK